MAIDTAAKRQVVAGVPYLPLGVNTVPGTLATRFGRAATAWTYYPADTPPPPSGDAIEDTFTVGTKESLSVTSQPTVGGRWSW